MPTGGASTATADAPHGCYPCTAIPDPAILTCASDRAISNASHCNVPGGYVYNGSDACIQDTTKCNADTCKDATTSSCGTMTWKAAVNNCLKC